jgi:hypothetical protein
MCDTETTLEQLKKYGTWKMETDSFPERCYYFYQEPYYYFQGLIANSRILNYGKNKKLILFVGVKKNKYIEVIVCGGIKFDSRKVFVKGKGRIINKLYNTIECWCSYVTFK